MTIRKTPQEAILYNAVTLLVNGIDAGVFNITHNRGDYVELISSGLNNHGEVLSRYESNGYIDIAGGVTKLLELIHSMPTKNKVNLRLKNSTVSVKFEADFMAVNKTETLVHNMLNRIEVRPL